MAALVTISVVGGAIGMVASPHVARRMGKKYGAIFMYTSALTVGVAPIVLRLMGWMPANGTPELFAILMVETLINTAFAGGTAVLLVSMVADVIEDAEVKTGRRSEGLLMSADNLFKKLVSGVGVFISGAVLAAIAFPENAKRGQVDPEIIHNMGLIYLPVIGVLFGLGIVSLSFFNIDKAKHEDNLRKLAAARSGAADQALEPEPAPEPPAASPQPSKA